MSTHQWVRTTDFESLERFVWKKSSNKFIKDFLALCVSVSLIPLEICEECDGKLFLSLMFAHFLWLCPRLPTWRTNTARRADSVGVAPNSCFGVHCPKLHGSTFFFKLHACCMIAAVCEICGKYKKDLYSLNIKASSRLLNLDSFLQPRCHLPTRTPAKTLQTHVVCS